MCVCVCVFICCYGYHLFYLWYVAIGYMLFMVLFRFAQTLLLELCLVGKKEKEQWHPLILISGKCWPFARYMYFLSFRGCKSGGILRCPNLLYNILFWSCDLILQAILFHYLHEWCCFFSVTIVHFNYSMFKAWKINSYVNNEKTADTFTVEMCERDLRSCVTCFAAIGRIV